MYVFKSRGTWAVVAGMLLVALATVGLASASPYKRYSVVLTDNVAASGSTVRATFLNENRTQRLGSADLRAPSGYVLSGATASQGSATLVGNMVELRNLGLMPGQSLTVTIQMASATCSARAWTVEAKQANNFHGRGNELTLDTANSNLHTAVCSMPCNKNATCTTDGSNSNGNARVTAMKSNDAGQLLESVNASNLAPLTCGKPDGSDYRSADPNTYGVLATVHRKKVVKITIINPVVSIPLNQQQVCFDAPYKFRTARGAPLLPDGNGGYIGLLAPCGADSDSAVRPRRTSASAGPCHDRDDDRVIASTVVLVVNIPSGLPQDPHMS